MEEKSNQEFKFKNRQLGATGFVSGKVQDEIFDKVKRTELYNSIYSLVKQIPRRNVAGDAMDAPSCTYEIEQLFYKYQSKKMYSEEELLNFGKIVLDTFHSEGRTHNDTPRLPRIKYQEWFNQFKKDNLY